MDKTKDRINKTEDRMDKAEDTTNKAEDRMDKAEETMNKAEDRMDKHPLMFGIFTLALALKTEIEKAKRF